MEISGGINRPTGVYTSNTANNINLAVEGENKIYGENIFSSEFLIKENEKTITNPNKRKRKSKRLNTIDSDFLPEEVYDEIPEEKNTNFFVSQKNIFTKTKENIKKSIKYIFEKIPVINYFYLKKKEEKIQKTVAELYKIVDNTDDLINSAVPYGENGRVYQKIAEGLTKGANVIGKANKEF